ncbi:choice-of-anchor M domain-containing protein [Candidatus Entotheonella palauensis]|nr:choice-of-anchor M domain-containing protein [Candidatus Entotheonella palauensis]
MARMRSRGTTAILYLVLIMAGFGMMGCSDSTDDPIAQPDTINPNLEGTFNGTGNLSLDGVLSAATVSLELAFPDEEDDLVERGLLRQQIDDPNLSGTIQIERSGAPIQGVVAGDAVEDEATIELTLVNLAGDVVQFESGHADLIVEYDADRDDWEFMLALLGATVDGVSGLRGELETDTVEIVVPLSNIESRPANVANLLNYDPIGVEAGVDYWKMPQTQTEATDETAPFVGINNEELPSGVFQNDTVTWLLNQVISPSGMGHFSLHQDAVPGPDFFISSADPNANPGVSLSVGLHDHFNYGFTEPGLWAIEFTASATRLDNTPTTGTGQFMFRVLDGSEGPPPTCTTILEGTISLVSDIIATLTAEGVDCNGIDVSLTGNLVRVGGGDDGGDHGHSHD